jgi:folate-binding protein YgfZ
MKFLALLPERGVIAVSGTDRVAFLQGLVSNDVAAARPGEAVWAALLTPQGKWFADFFIVAESGRLLLECERASAPAILDRLTRFRLRSKVQLQDCSDTYAVCAAWGDGAPSADGLIVRDPRLAAAGWRLLTDTPPPATASHEDWDRHRIALGLPDGSRDLERDRTVLLEAGFDELNGISWTKGCYMGQELTARTRYRGLVKRRLVTVRADGAVPPLGTTLTAAGAAVGTMRSGIGDLGLALLRLEALDRPLVAGDTRLSVCPASWLRLPERA